MKSNSSNRKEKEGSPTLKTDAPRITPLQPDDDLDSDWVPQSHGLAPVPNLVITAANVLEVYIVRLQHDPPKSSADSSALDGISGASLELVCHYRLHGNVESVAVLSVGGGAASKRRDSITLTFRDAKISVLEYDDSIHGLRTSSLHCFEGPEWLHLKRGREQFARGPVAKVDPQGRCGGVLVDDLQMIILKTNQAGSGLVGEDDVSGSGGAVPARIDSSYMINLCDLDMRHVKDFTFVHGYIEPVMVILHERELTWAGRVSWKHHTCTISTLSISTTLKQHPLIWSAVNLPHDAYKLLAVPSPIGGVLVIGANTIHYHSQSASCALALNSYAVSPDNSQEMPRSSFNVELDAANATWLLNDVALLSTKTGELLLLTLIYDGRVVQRLDLSKSKAAVLSSGITTIGNSMFFLASRLGDSMLKRNSSNRKEKEGSPTLKTDAPRMTPLQPDDDLDSDWVPQSHGLAPVPNLVITAANVLEVYIVRLQHDPPKSSADSSALDGISGASLELVCHYRLHGNVESVAVLSVGGGAASKRRDSITLTFRDAKISVLEYDDSIHGLRTSSLHCFEGPEWLHLKRGREQFARGPVAKVDSQGRCGGVLVYDLQMIILKTNQAGFGLVGEDDVSGSGGAVPARIDSSYMINLRDLDMRHVKDFTFVHGYIEPVMVILHERELTWARRVSWKHHTCTISALSISTTLKQHPLIWSAVNLPHDAYKLLAVPSPIGGVLVIGANTIHYHSQSASCALALNNSVVSPYNSQEMPRSSFNVELDAANATWLLNDVALLSTKTGELLLLTLIYDGMVVQRLDLSKSKAAVLSSSITTIGNSMFFLASRLGNSMLVQFSCGSGVSMLSSGLKEEVGDYDIDASSAKRLRRSPSDTLQDAQDGGAEMIWVLGSCSF
ncbi:hypothetical protein RYX36_014670 [Vicia faba]